MRIEFTLPDGEQVSIGVQVLDNPGARAWAEFFCDGTFRKGVSWSDHLHVHNYNPNKVYNRWCRDIMDQPTDLFLKSRQVVNEVLDDLIKLDYHYRGTRIFGEFATSPQAAHAWLNDLHRFFTHTQQSIDHRGDLNHSLKKILQGKLDSINQIVHELELYIPRGPSDLPVRDLEEVKLYDWSGDPVRWLDMKQWDQYHSREYHDVILGSEILGKTTLQSYLDLDNPNDWDTSGHWGSAGGLQLCVTDARQRLYASDSWREWLERHGMTVDTAWYDYPIGDVKPADRNDYQRIVELVSNSPANEITARYTR
jgi:hypothetical protein